MSCMKKLPDAYIQMDFKSPDTSIELTVKSPEPSIDMVDLTNESVSASVKSDDVDSSDDQFQKILDTKIFLQQLYHL